MGRIKNRNFNITDPDGHTVEIVQYMPDSWTVRENGKYLPERVSARVMHVGILVGSLAPAMQFYGSILGFQEILQRQQQRQNAQLGQYEGARWRYLHLEFMLYDQLPAPNARGTQHHMCLEVPDIDKAKAWLEARPALTQYTRTLEIKTGINRKRQLNLYDPDGTRLELMEPHTVDGQPAAPSTAPPPR